jgi:Fe-S-cluster containining protein
MKCLRCGDCCFRHDVIIIKPETIKKYDGKINFNKITPDDVKHKSTGKRCPHFKWSRRGIATCSIHSYSWFKNTPCGTYGQISESSNSPCRSGEFINKKYPDLREYIKDKYGI